MLITKEVEIKVGSQNVNHFKSVGYDVKVGNIITVPIEHLSKGSAQKIHITCDYCGKEIRVTYKDYLSNSKNGVIKKDCCGDCQYIKQKESMVKTYGVEYTMHVPTARQKMEETNLKKYGVKSPFESQKILDKAKQTVLDKYGVENVMHVPEIVEKVLDTNFKKYGFRHLLQSPEIKKKIISTNLKRYGVKNAMQNKDIATKCLDSMNKTKDKNKTTPSSSQQRYIHKQIGGELNYLVSRMWLDIAFPDEKLYIEYDGGGHWMRVTMGDLTLEEFNEKEKRRYYYLKDNGWKGITIVSKRNLVPCQQVLDNLISYSKEVLKTNNWIEFNLDDSQILTKNEIIHYDFKPTTINKIKQKHK